MTLRLAVAGIRHGHIFALVTSAQAHPEVEIVACCEEDAAARAGAPKSVTVTHDCYETMLRDVTCDIVAIGDYYTKRGGMAIRALETGRHVIADKPLCTRLDELERIEALAAEKQRSVGLMLDLRDNGLCRAVRARIQAGDIGTVHAISFGGQHPLMYGARAGWYFEPGKHGGTINDIAIHGIDLVPWMVGSPIARIEAARNWNAVLPQVPHFRDSAQLMLTLENGCGVLGDVSYLSPDSFSYDFPRYWEIVFWGSRGVIEMSVGQNTAWISVNGEKERRALAPEPTVNGGYFNHFIDEILGRADGDFTTADVLASSRWSLKTQLRADAV